MLNDISPLRTKIGYLLLLMALFLSSCAQNNVHRKLSILNIAILSDQNEQALHQHYQPLMAYITSYTGLEIKLVIPKSYSSLLDMFDRKSIDMALFGGVTYVKSHLKSAAVPLVMRNIDGEFRSVALARINYPANSLEEIDGGVLAFGSKLSTTGYYVPSYFLRKHDININDKFREIKYSGAHDLTAEWVRDGIADIGMSNSGVVNKMFLTGRLKKSEIKIIWQSPPFPDYTWAVQADIDPLQTTMIRDAFLSMGGDEETKLLLNKHGVEYYIPSRNSDFKKVASIILKIDKQDPDNEY